VKKENLNEIETNALDSEEHCDIKVYEPHMISKDMEKKKE